MNGYISRGRARRPLKNLIVISIVALAATLLPATPAFASWAANTSGTNVSLAGNAAADVVMVGVDQDGWLTHGITGAPFASTRDWDTDPGEQLVASSGSYNLTVNGGGGNDLISLAAVSAGALASTTVNGGPGNDFITGSVNPDALRGNDGHDRMTGGRGSDEVSGGDGSDESVWNHGDGNDDFGGAGGSDTLEIYGSPTSGDNWTVETTNTGFRASRGNIAPVSLDAARVESLHLNTLGGDDRVLLQGSVGRRTSITVDGHFDEDELNGGGAGETLDGSEDSDEISGGGGPDMLTGGHGGDALTGGDGPDLLSGDGGEDRLAGGDGPDVINSRDGARDAVRCGRGVDRVRADKKDVVRDCEQVNRD